MAPCVRTVTYLNVRFEARGSFEVERHDPDELYNKTAHCYVCKDRGPEIDEIETSSYESVRHEPTRVPRTHLTAEIRSCMCVQRHLECARSTRKLSSIHSATQQELVNH